MGSQAGLQSRCRLVPLIKANLCCCRMSKKLAKDHEWRIIRIKGSPAAYVGHVRAADEKEAIRKAIHEFQITNSEHQKRLVAERVD